MKLYTWDQGESEYVARFTALFTAEGETQIDVFGAPRFLARLDGEPLSEGPYRFERTRPVFERLTVDLPAGEHTLSALVEGCEFDTRMLQKTSPCFAVSVNGVPLDFKVQTVRGAYKVRRVNPQLGYAEFRDLRVEDGAMQNAVLSDAYAGCEFAPTPLKRLRTEPIAAKKIGEGTFVERFGYQDDDPPARFYMRNLAEKELPEEGVWFRYDLGKIRLFRFAAKIEAPAGTMVEIAYSERLTDGRVSPYITLSGGDSCNMDRYILQEGINEFGNISPRGGRYTEVHIKAPANKVKVHALQFIGREYLGEPIGSFECKDELLNRIWRTGIDTLRSCSEDSFTDNPTRERGEWTGDIVGAGFDLCAVGYADYALVKSGLKHAAECASSDGCVAGLSPGGVCYISTYALQWVCACMHHFELTGDRALLEELFESAQKNMEYFAAHTTDAGVLKDVYWSFVDWGYVPNEGESDMAVNLNYHAALRAMENWCKAIGKDGSSYRAAREKIARIVKEYIGGLGSFEELGMHRAVLALREKLLEGESRKRAIEQVKAHYLRCFPNDKSAPRLTDPAVQSTRLITPFFSHEAFRVLWEEGEGDFVLSQYRTCWGWMLTEANTWLEVFDPRWSNCHQWSGCPTWQLSRYVLGLQPRLDLGENTYEFTAKPCSLSRAKGILPAYGGGKIALERHRNSVVVTPDRAVTLLVRGEKISLSANQPYTLSCD